jgi:hypothetical protein
MTARGKNGIHPFSKKTILIQQDGVRNPAHNFDRDSAFPGSRPATNQD